MFEQSCSLSGVCHEAPCCHTAPQHEPMGSWGEAQSDYAMDSQWFSWQMSWQICPYNHHFKSHIIATFSYHWKHAVTWGKESHNVNNYDRLHAWFLGHFFIIHCSLTHFISDSLCLSTISRINWSFAIRNLSQIVWLGLKILLFSRMPQDCLYYHVTDP